MYEQTLVTKLGLGRTDNCFHFTLYSLSVLWLVKSLQLILETRATYRSASYLLAHNWLICRFRVQSIISNNNINSGSLRQCVGHYFLQNNSVIILNNQGLSKCYQHRPLVRLITLTLTLIIPDITKLCPIIITVYNSSTQGKIIQPAQKKACIGK